MSSEFSISKLATATKVIIKKDNQKITIPRSALRQCRDIALRRVAFDENCSINEIVKNEKKYNKQVEEVFKICLEDYADSVIPSANPARHRAEASVMAYSNSLGKEGQFWKKVFPNESESSQRNREQVFRSGLMKISDTYLDSVLEITARTIGEGPEIPKELLGLNFTSGLKKPMVKMVIINRYYQALVVAMLYAVLEKFFKDGLNNKKLIENYINKKLGDKNIGELNKKETAQEFSISVRNKARSIMADVDFSNFIK